MKLKIATISAIALCWSLPLSAKEAIKMENAENTMSELLSADELAKVKKAAKKQKKTAKKSTDESTERNEEDYTNPYSALIKDHGVEADDKTESDAPKVKRRRSLSSTSSTSYQRYKIGNRRPGDALKSRPAQRNLGR